MPHLPPLGFSFTTSQRRRGVSGTTRCSLCPSTQTSATGTSTSTGVQSYLGYCGNCVCSLGRAGHLGTLCSPHWGRYQGWLSTGVRALHLLAKQVLGRGATLGNLGALSGSTAVSWMLWRSCLQSGCFSLTFQWEPLMGVRAKLSAVPCSCKCFSHSICQGNGKTCRL